MKRTIKNIIDRDMVISHLMRLDLSRSYIADISEVKRIRTLPQNKLYRLWLVCIGHETGNDPDRLHEYFKEKFLEPEIHIIFGQQVKTYTTTNLNTIQFKNYLDKIQAFAASELAITLPDPESHYWQEFVEYYQDKL